MQEKIIIENEVLDYIKKKGGDFRICTSCEGPTLVPLEVSPKKDTDIVMNIGRQKLFVSWHQYNLGLRRITKDMIERKLCRFR